VETWRVFNSALFESLKLEQFAMFTILSFAILVAVMNITITLLMNIYYKKKNIGVLRSMGASQKQIRRIFLWEGLMLGGVGLVGGAILTGVLIFVIQNYEPFQLPAIYYDRSIPVEVRWQSLSVIYAVGAALILLATWLPSKKAAELDPVKAIREG
jgi:lipoprotein-releasing system permease protein